MDAGGRIYIILLGDCLVWPRRFRGNNAELPRKISCLQELGYGEARSGFNGSVFIFARDAFLYAENVSVVPQVAFIDSQIESAWADANVQPAEEAVDLEWCRRVYLDLVGRIPTVDEVLEYKNASSRNKRSVLVDRLLGEGYAKGMRSIGQMCGRQYLLAETLIIGWLTEMVCGNICRPRGSKHSL